MVAQKFRIKVALSILASDASTQSHPQYHSPLSLYQQGVPLTHHTMLWCG